MNVCVVVKLVLVGLMLLPLRQDMPDLIVTLRDVQGQDVAGARVQVRDRSGQQTLVEQQTDASGQARFAALPETEIRVAVSGQLPDGTSLFQPGQDAAGVFLILGAPPTTLELRIEPSGQVLPDPVTMIAPERNPVNAFPTAPFAPTFIPSTPILVTLPPVAASEGTAIPTSVPTVTPTASSLDEAAGGVWPVWLIPLGILVVGTLLVLACGRRRGAP